MHSAATTLSWRSIAIVLLYGGTLLSVNLGGLGRALTYHEVLFAQPAREMLSSGDWVVPRILGVPDTHKPPLTSWILAGTISILGESDWAVRVPSVLAALMTAVWLAALAARWFGDLQGCVTGLIHVTMYYVLQFGRLAESDVFLVLWVALAMGVFMLGNLDCPYGRRAERGLPLLFYFACGLAFMTKGLIGLAFIGLGCGLYALWQRERDIWRFLFDPVGLLLFLVCLSAWPVAAYLVHPGYLDDQITHHLGRFQGRLGTDEPIYCYFYAIPRCALPWTPLALRGIVVGWRHGWLRGPLGRFTLCWVVPGVAILTASAWRHYHYVAPLMPPVAWLAAVGLVDVLNRIRVMPGRVAAGASILTCVAWSLAMVFVSDADQLRGRGPILAVLTVAGVGTCALIGWVWRRPLHVQLSGLLGLVWLLVAGTFAWVIPHYDVYSQQMAFARRVDALTPADAPVYMVDLWEDQLAWYLRQPLVRVDEVAAISDRVLGEAAYLVVPQGTLAQLASRAHVAVIERSQIAPRRNENLRVCLVRWQRRATSDNFGSD